MDKLTGFGLGQDWVQQMEPLTVLLMVMYWGCQRVQQRVSDWGQHWEIPMDPVMVLLMARGLALEMG